MHVVGPKVALMVCRIDRGFVGAVALLFRRIPREVVLIGSGPCRNFHIGKFRIRGINSNDCVKSSFDIIRIADDKRPGSVCRDCEVRCDDEHPRTVFHICIDMRVEHALAFMTKQVKIKRIRRRTLFCHRIPDEVILSVCIAPNRCLHRRDLAWNQNVLRSNKISNILYDRLCTHFDIAYIDGECCTAGIESCTRIVRKVYMRKIITLTIFMAINARGNSIASVTLFHCLIPDDIVLPIRFTPNRNLYFGDAFPTNDI